MNEFEKIRKRMEKATEFLSDCTKYGNKDAVQQRKSYDTMYMYEIALLVEELIDIVSEVEAEYGKDINVRSNGWIPCSERMPEDFLSVLCYAESIARSPDTIFVGSQKHGCWFLQSSIGTESFPTQYEVIAWMPLPEAYKPTTD